MWKSGEHGPLARRRRQLAGDLHGVENTVLIECSKSFSAGCRKAQAGSLCSPEIDRINFCLYETRIDAKFHFVTRFDLRKQDCTAGMSRLADDSVDLVMTSPPYNLGISYGKYSDRQDRRSYIGCCSEWARQVRRVLNSSGSFFLNIGGAPSNPMLPHEIVMTLSDFFVLQNTIHWIKSIAIEQRCSRRPVGDVKAETNQMQKPLPTGKRLQFAHLVISSRSIRPGFSMIATNTFFISQNQVGSNSTGWPWVCHIKTRATSRAGPILAGMICGVVGTRGSFLMKQFKAARKSGRIRQPFRFNSPNGASNYRERHASKPCWIPFLASVIPRWRRSAAG